MDIKRAKYFCALFITFLILFLCAFFPKRTIEPNFDCFNFPSNSSIVFYSVCVNSNISLCFYDCSLSNQTFNKYDILYIKHFLIQCFYGFTCTNYNYSFVDSSSCIYSAQNSDFDLCFDYSGQLLAGVFKQHILLSRDDLLTLLLIILNYF